MLTFIIDKAKLLGWDNRETGPKRIIIFGKASLNTRKMLARTFKGGYHQRLVIYGAETIVRTPSSAVSERQKSTVKYYCFAGVAGDLQGVHHCNCCCNSVGLCQN